MSESQFISDDPQSPFFECPRFLWIGAIRFEIKVMNEDTADLAGLLGCAHPVRAEILLANSGTSQVIANTAIHEVIHCINRDRDIPGHGDEEYITDQMASGLCDFRIRNPEFFKWWEAMLNA